MAITLKCHKCGATKIVDAALEFYCPNCGSCNVIPNGYDTADEVCGCIAPDSFEWTLPAGVLEGPTGKIFISAQGTRYTKARYMADYGLDPEIALAWMRGRRGKK